MNFSEMCKFTPKQWEATEQADVFRFFLFGGRRGPGKSYWIRWYCLRRLLMWAARGFRNVRVGLFSEDFPTLRLRQVSKISQEFPPWLGRVKGSLTDGYGFFLRPEFGGGVISFFNLDDVHKYRGVEMAGLAVEEITMNREFADSEMPLFDVLRGSMRWPGIEDNFFISASNPNGVGQSWVRRLWIEKSFTEHWRHLVGMESQFGFLPGGPADNPHLPRAFHYMLDTLPEKLRRAWRDGDWYVSFEGVVFPEFTQENLATFDYDPALPVEWAVDDGYSDPRAILFIQKQGTRVLVFDELYHTKHLAEVCIAEALQQRPQSPEIAICSKEDVELQARLRVGGIVARHGSHEVVEGVKHLRALFCDGAGVRTIFVHPRCTKLIWELTEGYVYPTGKKSTDNEKPQDGNDHACEALRKWAWVRMRR